jgi:HlyD family secretion protein
MQAMWQKIRQYKWWIIALIIIAAAAKFGSDYYAKSSKPAFTGTVVTVERGDIQSVVSATGTISPVNSVDVSSKITGRIVEVKVNENDTVKTDQVLILLDDTRYQTTVSQSEARLANSAANYERVSRLAAIGALSTQQLDAARMSIRSRRPPTTTPSLSLRIPSSKHRSTASSSASPSPPARRLRPAYPARWCC